jgi:hypothetical protein
MPSTYANLMRNGKQSFNCAVSVVGNQILVSPYFGTPGPSSPLLCRFSPTQFTERTSNISITIPNTCSFGQSSIQADPNLLLLSVGLQYLSPTNMQVVFGYNISDTADYDKVATVLPANATTPTSIAAPTAIAASLLATNPIVWLGKLLWLRSSNVWTAAVYPFNYRQV